MENNAIVRGRGRQNIGQIIMRDLEVNSLSLNLTHVGY